MVDSPLRRRFDIALIIAFAIAMAVPMLDMIFRFDPTPNTEMRALAPAPAFPTTLTQAKDYPAAFKLWIGDHFGLRNLMIHWHGIMKVEGFGVTSSDHAVLGKSETDAAGREHQWLYYAAYGTMQYHLARKPFTPVELLQWQRVLEMRRDWLASRGCRYLFIIAPNAQTIYPEFLPDEWQRVGAKSRGDQLVAHLREHSTIEIVDMREAVADYKMKHPQQRLYHRTDTHWNDVGAFAGYLAVAGRLKAMFAKVEPLSWDQFDITHRQTPGGDLAGVLGIRDHFTEDRIELVAKPPLKLKVLREEYDKSPHTTQAPGKGLPRLVMFRDSFGSFLKPYLAEHFDKAVFVWSDQFHPEYVDQHQPDVVITQMVERFFWRDPPAAEKLP
ncbi:MAG: hypothetical protein WD768_19665 [Phycisphaeraceae bacterium]